jgi:nicotinamide/nicotinate riboside kinase
VQPFVDSKEDKNSVGACPVSDAKIAEVREKVEAWMRPGQPGHRVLGEGEGEGEGEGGLRVCLVDGFLLYSEQTSSVMDLLDVRLFLLVSKAKATRRREARDGYVTIEGFWTDPPGYVDKVVWPNYAEAHAWLFENGDVDGQLDERSLKEKNILAQVGRGLDVEMDVSFEWVVDTLMRQLEQFGADQ